VLQLGSGELLLLAVLIVPFVSLVGWIISLLRRTRALLLGFSLFCLATGLCSVWVLGQPQWGAVPHRDLFRLLQVANLACGVVGLFLRRRPTA